MGRNTSQLKNPGYPVRWSGSGVPRSHIPITGETKFSNSSGSGSPLRIPWSMPVKRSAAAAHSRTTRAAWASRPGARGAGTSEGAGEASDTGRRR